jgi:hypothetical protein
MAFGFSLTHVSMQIVGKNAVFLPVGQGRLKDGLPALSDEVLHHLRYSFMKSQHFIMPILHL